MDREDLFMHSILKHNRIQLLIQSIYDAEPAIIPLKALIKVQ